ncbi:MAG: hypothetical protein K0S65_876, partial [Labilithrix sp.]|nr:hypothetical protein [Labilithrix sp.]
LLFSSDGTLLWKTSRIRSYGHPDSASGVNTAGMADEVSNSFHELNVLFGAGTASSPTATK